MRHLVDPPGDRAGRRIAIQRPYRQPLRPQDDGGGAAFPPVRQRRHAAGAQPLQRDLGDAAGDPPDPARPLVDGAEEARDEAVGRAVVEFGRRAHLLDTALTHDRDPVRQREGLVDVVGDENGGDAEAMLQVGQFAAHVLAQAGIEVRQGLVEQQQVRLDDDGAGERDALLLSARQFGGLAPAIALQPHRGQRARHPRLALGPRDLAHGEAEADVLRHRHVREEGVVLEDEADPPGPDRGMADVGTADRDAAAVGREDACDQTQERRLAAARRPQHGEELTGPDLDVDAVDRRRRAEPLDERLGLQPRGSSAHRLRIRAVGYFSGRTSRSKTLIQSARLAFTSA